MLTIAFRITGHAGWIAGRVHVAVFVHAMRTVYRDQVRLILLAAKPKPDIEDYARETKFDEIVYYKGKEWVCIQEAGIQVVFGRTLVHPCFATPTLSWLPDFQHLHLSDFFSRGERSQRSEIYRESANHSTRVILMSESSRRDFEDFLPQEAKKARVLKTTSIIPPDTFGRDPYQMVHKYALPDRFVYLPNQFWKHKNHARVFRALNVLKKRGVKVHLVCSGSTSDYRFPRYYDEMGNLATQLGVREQVSFLGMIPKPDVLQLMRQSVCVLNPSLFEGFGLSSDEARCLGKWTVSSDIPALREQESELTAFFDPYQHENMADVIQEAYENNEAGPHPARESAARMDYPARLRTCAESFMRIVREVVDAPSKVHA